MNVDKAQSDVDAQQKIVNQLRVDKEQVSQKKYLWVLKGSLRRMGIRML